MPLPPRPPSFLAQSHLGGWWADHSAEIITGVITAVLSAIATYYAMKALGSKDQ